ncbi:tail-specific protease, partial [Pseudidiomarina aestuarii]
SFLSADEFGESSQDNALPWDQLESARYAPLKEFEPTRINQWQQTVDERIQENPEFVYVLEDIEEFKADQDQAWISLVLAERKAEQEREDAKKLERANARLVRLGKEPVEKLEDLPNEIEVEDPYLTETIALSFDIIDDLKLAMN